MVSASMSRCRTTHLIAPLNRRRYGLCFNVEMSHHPPDRTTQSNTSRSRLLITCPKQHLLITPPDHMSQEEICQEGQR